MFACFANVSHILRQILNYLNTCKLIVILMRTISTGIVTSIIVGTLLLASATIVNAQPTTAGGQVIATAKQVRDEIVSGGQSIASQALKGGVGFLKTLGTLFGVHDVVDHVNTARQDLASGNTAGASAELNKVNAALKNDSITISGLGQEITSIAQNKSMSLNNNTRLIMTTVGNDLTNISLHMEGVDTTSASGSNSTK
jgi:hypothetical protein